MNSSGLLGVMNSPRDASPASARHAFVVRYTTGIFRDLAEAHQLVCEIDVWHPFDQSSIELQADSFSSYNEVPGTDQTNAASSSPLFATRRAEIR